MVCTSSPGEGCVLWCTERSNVRLPHNKPGDAPNALVVFDGIGFDHAPRHGIEARLLLSVLIPCATVLVATVNETRRGAVAVTV